MIGTTISHYTILEKLGEGGMGVVYKAEDTKLKRIVALKFLPAHLTSTGEEQARFQQEAQAAATLNHPNICTIHAIEEHEGPAYAGAPAGRRQFIDMEFVDGVTLRKKLPISNLNEAVSAAIQIGEALQEAHTKGIVHRDVKADNIMVNSRNQIKVMDFGLAKLKGSLKLTKASSTVGTLAYMAPEQIQGGEVDARSDIFSYGIVLFEILGGKTPFRGEHDAAMMYSILNEEPDSILKHRPDLSPEFDHIIQRALEKDPEDRYQSVADMVSELRREQKKSGRVTRPSLADLSPVRQPSVEERSVVPQESRPKTRALVLGVLGVVLVGVAVSVYLFTGRQQPIDSLAVLPFENVGGGQDLEYLSDGITESIINNLTKIQGLRVVPRGSAFRFKGKDVDFQEVASKLSVSAILTGRIVHRGTTLDVQVDLIDVRNESQLWGNRYETDLNSILSLQDNITREVSSKLGVGLSPDTREKLTKRYTENTQAYSLYLQGRFYWNKRTASALERAINYLNQAIALDSTFALAYAGLADCYIIQSQYAGTPTSVTIPLTQSTAQHALELDNSLAEAHTTLAFSYFEQFKYEDAEREFKQSIALNPRYATTYHWYGIMQGRTGNYPAYLSTIQQALEIDPYSPVIALNLGIAHFLLGHNEEALRQCKKSVELDPSFASGYAWSGLFYERMRNYPEALVQLQKAVELSGRSSECVSYLGYYYGRVGKRTEALALLKENETRYREGTGSAYNIARIYAGLGEREKIIQWLELDYNDRSTWINSLISDFSWDDVRSDPRFVELTKKVGLVK